MSIETVPHASWADVYDMVYERSFGQLYTHLTDITIETINKLVVPPARIIDFGAGTGRLSIPLAELGYMVTAVEPSKEMLNKLKQKDHAYSVRSVISTMQEYKGNGDHDLALCVFTVLLYLLDERSLKEALIAAYGSLKKDALFLLDIPSEHLFHSYSFSDEKISRHVNIKNVKDNIYEYTENIIVSNSYHEDTEYSDTFPIKHWSTDEVFNMLEEIGFIFINDESKQFKGTGSQYFVFKRS